MFSLIDFKRFSIKCSILFYWHLDEPTRQHLLKSSIRWYKNDKITDWKSFDSMCNLIKSSVVDDLAKRIAIGRPNTIHPQRISLDFFVVTCVYENSTIPFIPLKIENIAIARREEKKNLWCFEIIISAKMRTDWLMNVHHRAEQKKKLHTQCQYEIRLCPLKRWFQLALQTDKYSVFPRWYAYYLQD